MMKFNFPKKIVESNWKDKFSSLTIASSLDLDQLKKEYQDTNLEVKQNKTKKKFSKDDCFKPTKEEQDDIESLFEVKYNPPSPRKMPPDFEEKCIDLSGRDLVFYLLEATHLGNAVSFYLNLVKNSKYFRPYDLVTVPQIKKEPEHYIFSVFGILHVYPGQDENEQLTLPEWNRHAVLWEACTKIKFFKQFLTRKFMFRWRQNSKFSKFIKLKKQISKEIILAIPIYSEAMILCSKLVQEIFELKFVPKEEDITKSIAQEFLERNQTAKSSASNHVSPISSRYSTQELIDRAQKRKQSVHKQTFTLDKYLNSIQEIRFKSEKILKYFFIFVKSILDNSRQKLYDKFRFYERLYRLSVDNLDMVNSLSIQKDLKIEREKLLDKCRHEISMIGNFIDLISVFLGTNMLMISRNETKYFLNEIVGCIESKRGHLFEADLGFDKNNNLSMIPNRNKFLNDIMRSIEHILEQIIENSKILDFEGSLRDIEKYGFKLRFVILHII